MSKGYICQDLQSKKIYITCHVIFHESSFPTLFYSTTSDASSSNSPSPSPSLELWLASLLSSSPSFSSPSYSSCTIPVSASITSLDSDTNPPLPELPSSLPLSHLSLLPGP